MTVWTVFGLGVGAVALAAQRHVLRRPQPLAEPDRMAADDAIRSRSLHVLAAADTRRLLTEAVRSFAATTRRLGIADHDALAAVASELGGESAG